jgi:sulfide dehydrogenase cytochrome subunit
MPAARHRHDRWDRKGKWMSARQLPAAMLALCCSVASAHGAPDGMRLAESCTPCHGGAGKGGDAIPRLAGRDEADLARRMSELAAGDPQAAIMTRLMRAYDEAEIDALARYFSQVQP